MTPESRFWSKTVEQGECVIWTAGLHSQGYGVATWEGRTVLAHRLAFFLRLGRWPETDLRHLCNNKPCILHGVEGTRSQNELDKVAAGTHHYAKRTHCKHNHEFTPDNTYTYRGARHCRACRRERNRKRA